jgi:hypothetical protein
MEKDAFNGPSAACHCYTTPNSTKMRCPKEHNLVINREGREWQAAKFAGPAIC